MLLVLKNSRNARVSFGQRATGANEDNHGSFVSIRGIRASAARSVLLIDLPLTFREAPDLVFG